MNSDELFSWGALDGAEDTATIQSRFGSGFTLPEFFLNACAFKESKNAEKARMALSADNTVAKKNLFTFEPELGIWTIRSDHVESKQ